MLQAQTRAGSARSPSPDSTATAADTVRTAAGQPIVIQVGQPQAAATEAKTEKPTPFVDNLVPSWQPARFGVQVLVVIGVLVGLALLVSVAINVAHRVYHFFASGGWDRQPAEIQELSVGGVLSLKQAQAAQQGSDLRRDAEIAALRKELDEYGEKHDALLASVAETQDIAAALSARLDALDPPEQPLQEAAKAQNETHPEGDADAEDHPS